MATVAIVVVLALAWMLVLARGRRRMPSPLESVERHHRTLAAVDLAARSSGEPTDARRARPDRRARREPRIARRSSGWSSSRLRVGTVAAIVAAVAAVGLAVVLSQARGHGQRSASSSHHGSTARSSTGRTPQPAPTTSTTTPAVVLTGRDAGSASYSVTSHDFVVNVSANGPCWIEARTRAGGEVIQSATMQAGENRAFAAHGSLWLRLGDPNNATVIVNDSPVDVSGRMDVPLNVAFTAGATSPAPTSR